jgi:NH3-dependent NAD+ synthetase
LELGADASNIVEDYFEEVQQQQQQQASAEVAITNTGQRTRMRCRVFSQPKKRAHSAPDVTRA